MSSDRDREEREYGDRYSDEKYDDADGGGRKDEEETEDREARDEREDREGNGSADQMEEELAVYVGNFEYRTTTRDLERLFERFGSVKKVDMKVGFAFVFMGSKDDGDDLIKEFDGTTFGSRQRRLRVEWAKGDGRVKKREDSRRSQNMDPSDTVFVVGFDPSLTKDDDLRDYFSGSGRIVRLDVRGTFAFIQYGSVEDATEAIKNCHDT
mmetsp:Transcript_6127/g.25911  ORF Transcript_6127/g.25911 Transcript_6127/m.25911 type:complete len:210 (-) Transcript_6127:2153-2782(-)